MWSELKKSITSIFEERITSPFYGAFIFSWLIWNWKIVYLTIFVSQENIEPSNKIDYILEHYINWWYLTCNPLISAVILVTLVPWASNRLFKIHLYYEKQRALWREESDSTRRLTIENSAQIRNEIFEQELKHEKQIESKNSEIKIANDQIEKFATEKLKLQEQIVELNETSKVFKILYARYGKNEIYFDVTTKVSELIATQSKFLIKNDVLGGDPIFGSHKELFILYNTQNSLQTITIKEYYEVELKDEILVATETGESKIVYDVEPSHLILPSLDGFFPGIWELSYKGTLTGREEIQIVNGIEYFAKILGGNEFRHFFNLRDISINLETKALEFTKESVISSGRNIKSVLNIVEAGRHYAGTEDNGAVQVSYAKIRDN